MTAVEAGFAPSQFLSDAETRGFSPETSRERPVPRILRGRRSRQFPAPDAALTGEALAELPGWLEPVLTQLVELLKLDDNWDSYGARRIAPAEVAGAIELLVTILDEDAPAPRIGPTGRGGVVIEWHRNRIDLEIETLSPHRFSVAFEDENNSWEREIVSDLRPVVGILRRLA